MYVLVVDVTVVIKAEPDVVVPTPIATPTRAPVVLHVAVPDPPRVPEKIFHLM
jgi:hypothetical protein